MESRLTTADWRKIKVEYLKGKTTYKKLGEKYGVSESVIRKRASKEGWREQRNNFDTKVEQKVLERACDARAKEFETLAQAAEQVETILVNVTNFIAQQPKATYEDLRGVESLTKAVAEAVELKRNLYNIPNEVDKANIAAKNEANKLNRARLNLERKKYRDEQAEKAKMQQAAEGTMIKVVIENKNGGEEKVVLDE